MKIKRYFSLLNLFIKIGLSIKAETQQLTTKHRTHFNKQNSATEYNTVGLK